MPEVSNARRSGVLSSPLLATVRLLLSVALIVDVYLVWVSISGDSVAGCGPASNCQAVLSSRWSRWLGIPVSAPALLVYAGLLGATFSLNPSHSVERRRQAWRLLLAGAAIVAGAAIWFIALQLFVLKAICQFCMTAHGCGLLASIIIFGNSPVRREPKKASKAAKQVFIVPESAARIYLGAAVCVALFIAGQLVQQPKAYVSTPISAGLTTNVAAPSVREFQLFDGQLKLNLHEVPLYGSPAAPHAIVSLFDYTCHHCREMHGPLMEAHRKFGDRLAIVSLPMPLDGKCNPIVKRTLSAHTNACALARLSLTVWRADRKAWPKFEEWVFGPERPPLPEEAERYAKALVGTNAFEMAASNRWVDMQIRQDVAVYEAVYRRFRKGYMPEVIIGTNLLSGVFGRDRLFQLLSSEFGLEQAQRSNAPAQ